MSFADLSATSAPITELELLCDFTVAHTVSCADMFWELVDGDLVDGEWANAGTRSRLYASLRASGCGKRMIDGMAYFIFADGSAITVSRFGIER